MTISPVYPEWDWERSVLSVDVNAAFHTIQALMSLNINTNELLRVSINPHGRFDIVDFTTPSKEGRVRFFNALQEEIPQWVVEAVSMLRMTEERSVVPDLGYKVNDKLYYIIDRSYKNEA
jgi:hypothetical protein